MELEQALYAFERLAELDSALGHVEALHVAVDVVETVAEDGLDDLRVGGWE